jgi:hypothetical protein
VDALHSTVNLFLQIIVYFTACFHNFLNFKELFLVGFDVLIVLKLNHAHPDDLFFKLLHILLVLVVDALALRDAGGQDLTTGSPLEQLVIATQLRHLPHLPYQCPQHKDLSSSTRLHLQYCCHALPVFALDVVHCD